MNNKVTELINSEINLELGYEDIVELAKACKFYDCTHTTEPDCAVQNAINKGVISEERFNKYYRDKNEEDYVSKQKNKTKAIDYMKQRKLFER